MIKCIFFEIQTLVTHVKKSLKICTHSVCASFIDRIVIPIRIAQWYCHHYNSNINQNNTRRFNTYHHHLPQNLLKLDKLTIQKHKPRSMTNPTEQNRTKEQKGGNWSCWKLFPTDRQPNLDGGRTMKYCN